MQTLDQVFGALADATRRAILCRLARPGIDAIDRWFDVLRGGR